MCFKDNSPPGRFGYESRPRDPNDEEHENAFTPSLTPS